MLGNIHIRSGTFGFFNSNFPVGLCGQIHREQNFVSFCQVFVVFNRVAESESESLGVVATIQDLSWESESEPTGHVTLIKNRGRSRGSATTTLQPWFSIIKHAYWRKMHSFPLQHNLISLVYVDNIPRRRRILKLVLFMRPGVSIC